MNRISWAAGLSLLVTVANGVGATVPLYENNSSYSGLGPQIDARAWVNRSLFQVFTATGLPFESQNTRFFTNTASGVMVGNPGFRFFYNTNGQRLSMDTWVNEGSIATDAQSFSSSIFFLDSSASILQVKATNIISRGNLSSGSQGLVRLEGKNISLPRIGIRTGSSSLSTPVFSGGFLGLSNYVNDFGVTDLYWGAGTNNALRPSGAMPLNGGFFGFPRFSLPLPTSPQHEVASRSTFGFLSTNTTYVPGGFFFSGSNVLGGSFQSSGYGAAVYTNQLSATSSVVQVVFYPTNTDSSASTEVRFADFGNGVATVVVGFHAVDFDIATQTATTNSVFLADDLATRTNVFFARNLGANTRRPNTFEVTRTVPFEYDFGVTNNAVFSSDLLVSSNYVSRSVTNLYAAYAARIEGLGSSPSGSVPYDVTNVPGRVEIIGDQVNLERTRIRAESAFILKTANLVSNRLAAVDAPLIDIDVRSTQPTLVISNLAPTTVNRFAGTLRAWSGRWVNQEATFSGTNTILFHVLIVENALQSTTPVSVNRLAIRGTNHVISDVLTISKGFVVEGQSLHVQGGLNLPFGYALAATNMLGLTRFTNDGIISLSASESFGTDRTAPYLSYVNRGTNSATSHFIRALSLDNSGYIISTSGPLWATANTLSLQGTPFVGTTNLTTNTFFTVNGPVTIVTVNVTPISIAPTLQSPSEVRLSANTLVVSNSVINAGTLVLNVTNVLDDSGVNGLNHWNVTNGFQVTRVPAGVTLYGTELRSTVPAFGISQHNWAGADLGPVEAGFVDNLAVRKLTFDGGNSSTFAFSAADGVNAIYVDYLEFLNFATNYNGAFEIDGNFTIYFANANVSAEKLNGAAGGRFVWVPDYAGPLSSTNIFYNTTGETYTFNVAKVLSMDLDSDGDGIPNAIDPEPIYVSANAFIRVALSTPPARQAILSWSALAYSTNSVEYKGSPDETDWRVLTNFVHGPFTMPVSMTDPLPTNGTSRIYRLRVNPMRP